MGKKAKKDCRLGTDEGYLWINVPTRTRLGIQKDIQPITIDLCADEIEGSQDEEDVLDKILDLLEADSDSIVGMYVGSDEFQDLEKLGFERDYKHKEFNESWTHLDKKKAAKLLTKKFVPFQATGFTLFDEDES